MDADKVLKDRYYEKLIFQKRASFCVLLVAVLFFTLLSRLVYLQVINHDHYQTLSDNNRISVIAIAPIRGKIFDRNGKVLADNQPTFNLEITPKYTNNLEDTLNEISKIITITPEELLAFKTRVKKSASIKASTLKLNITEEEIARISVQLHRLPGINIKASFKRIYPYKKIAAHLLGYVARINEQEQNKIDSINYAATNYIGKTGIEKKYESVLHGTVGYSQIETDAKGNILRVLKHVPPIPGTDLHLNIDIRLQSFAQKLLENKRGAVVALNPNNGAVLALVSSPSFDPNLFVSGLNTEEYKKLNCPKTRPLFNRSIQGQYPPASIIKPIMALAGIDTGHISPTTQIKDPGWYKIENDNHLYRNWKKTGHGAVDLYRSIVVSCDTYFYKLADELGLEIITSWFRKFGLGELTGIDLINESKGLVPSREWKLKTKNEPWYRGETIISGIGQGFLLTTPLQLASSISAFANKGDIFTPQILAKKINTNNNVEIIKPELKNKVNLNENKNWGVVIEAMRQSVHTIYGTAYNRIGRHIDYELIGKTGTSQVFSIKQNETYNRNKIAEHLRDHSVYAGYAPAKNPEIAVAVLIENNPGSAVACRKIITEYLKNILK